MTPNFPDTAVIYTVSGNEWGDEVATTEVIVNCIVEQTNTHSRAGDIESGEGGARMFCLKQGTDLDGKLVQYDGNWFRVVSEYEPKRSIFSTAVNHIEVELQNVIAPETVV